jgi:hypothetical protein
MFSLKVIKECKTYKNYDLCIACSLFKMKQAYRAFGKYITFFRKWMNRIPRTSYIRLYVDASVMEDEDFINMDLNVPHLEIILYEFPQFVTDTSGAYYHDGTVGTMARFLPLYNQPILPPSVKYVWITDVDMSATIFNYSNIKELNRYKADISFLSKACYTYEWANPELQYPILAGRIISSTNCMYSLKAFNNFLQDVLDGKYMKLKDRILSRLTDQPGNVHRMTQDQIKYFPYGFDELFTNYILSKDILRYRYLVYYDISFHYLNYVYSFSNREKLLSIDSKLWKGKGNKLTLEKEFKKELEKSYNEVLASEKPINPCIKAFDKYKNKLYSSPSTWSLMTLISDPKNGLNGLTHLSLTVKSGLSP